MYEEQQTTEQAEDAVAVGNATDAPAQNASMVAEETPHGECCEDCKRTCKRNFWTEMLRAIVKISTIVLAAFGIESLHPLTPPPIGG